MLIENAGAIWHRLWSMRLMIATTAYSAAAGAWVLLPPDWRPDLSEGARSILAGVGVALPATAAIARLIRQDKLADGKGDPQ